MNERSRLEVAKGKGDVGMEQHAIGTIDRPMRDRPMRIAEDLGTGERMPDIVDELCDSSARWLGTVLANIEDMIERYPWPTVLFGIGVGYLISRRAR
jgi:hypothetical protein